MKRNWMALISLVAGISVLAQAQDAGAPPAAAVPPPAAPAKKSAAELEKLAEPIAIWPDPLLASALPASVYPLEIVQAARFMADPNNASKLDEQPWDDNVKAIARVPEALKQMNDNLPWTIQLGEAFINQDRELMDAIQSLRMKAQKAGTLRTTEQQVVVVTNTVVETVVQEKPVIVTNTVVQVVPSNPEVVYVPQYVSSAVYYPPPSYVYDPYAPLITFGAGVAVGVILANGCDWHHGGVYHGGYYGGYHHGGDYHGDKTKIKVEGDVNIGSGNRNNIGSGNRAQVNPQGNRGAGQKWKADQGRLGQSGARGTGASTREARGWGSGASASTRPAGGGGAAATRPSTGAGGARPSTGGIGSGAGAGSSRPAASTRPSTTPSAGSQRPAATSPSTRPSTGASSGTRQTTSSFNRPSTSQSSGSAFKSSGSSSSVRSASSRGSSSRSAGGGGGSRGGGGGGRGGGGGGRR